MTQQVGNNWLLRNASFVDSAERVDIFIQGTRIQYVGSSLENTSGAQELDLDGRLVIPGFVDAHMHLDKAYALDTGLMASDTLEAAIVAFTEWGESATPDLIYQNALRAAQQALVHGTVALRTHVMVYPQGSQEWLGALIRVREEMAPWLEVQLAIMPSVDMFDEPGGYDLLRGAMQSGADQIGGAPAFASDQKASIDKIYEIAGEYGRDIDVHIDETDDPNSNTLEYLAERKLALGFEGSVTAGHCTSLSAMDEVTAGRVIEKVAEAGIHVITLPSCNMYLMGRRDKGMVRRGLTRVRELLAAGVNVAYATDNIRDAFTPFGKADMLQGGLIAAHALHIGTPADQRTLLAMGTTNPAQILKLKGYGLEPGCTASLVVLDEKNWSNAIAKESPRRYVFSQGRLVAQTEVDQKLLI